MPITVEQLHQQSTRKPVTSVKPVGHAEATSRALFVHLPGMMPILRVWSTKGTYRDLEANDLIVEIDGQPV